MSICRQSTIERLKYDPEVTPPTTKQQVMWIYPCCGLRQMRMYGSVGPRCYTCFTRDRKAARPKQIEPVRTETKMLHGQLVEVKIYQLGAPADYTPSYME